MVVAGSVARCRALGNSEISQDFPQRLFLSRTALLLFVSHWLARLAKGKASKFCRGAEAVWKFEVSHHCVEERQHTILKFHRLFRIARSIKIEDSGALFLE